MYLGKKYIAIAAVEYRIEVRLTDCAIRRSQSFLSSLPISSRRFLGVFAIHVEVIWMVLYLYILHIDLIHNIHTYVH